MQFRVGQDIVTSCGRCKQKTWHVIFAMEGDAVKRVQCKICMSYHNYHPDPEERESNSKGSSMSVRRRREGEDVKTVPTGTGAVKAPLLDDDEPAPAPKAARRTSSAAPRRKKEAEAPDYTELWNQALKGKDMDSILQYRPDLNYEDDMLISHPNF